MTEDQMLELMERMVQWVCGNVNLTLEEWIIFAKIRDEVQNRLINKGMQENE